MQFVTPVDILNVTNKRNMKNKTYEIVHSYFKKGDDFNHFLEINNGKVVSALRDWAESLSTYAYDLRKMAELLQNEKDLEGEGCTHYAAIHNISEEIGKRLLEIGILQEDPFEEEGIEIDEETNSD